MTKALFSQLVPDELARVKELLGEKAYAAGNYPEGARLFEQLTLADEFADFLTLSAYDWVTAHEHR